MKDPRDMSPSELRELADKKEKESKPVKEGFLKHDLYELKSMRSKSFSDGVFCVTEEVIDNILDEIKMYKIKIASKGDRFVCFAHDNEEEWFDNDGYIESMDEKWAKANLKNIQKI